MTMSYYVVVLDEEHWLGALWQTGQHNIRTTDPESAAKFGSRTHAEWALATTQRFFACPAACVRQRVEQ